MANDRLGLTPNEVAETLKLHPRTVYRMIKRGDLPAWKIGHVWRVSVDVLRDYLAGHAPRKEKDTTP